MEVNAKKGKEIIMVLTIELTLKLFRVGCDEKNYNLLNKLPLTAKEVEKLLQLSPMPTNRRLKELMEVGLINREKIGEKIKLTPLGNDFKQHIENLREEVVQNMAKLI